MSKPSRSRDSCVTCKKRKKKCDLQKPACHNCTRLGIHCEGYQPRLVWEDDSVRQAIRRRGPPKAVRPPESTHLKKSIPNPSASINSPFDTHAGVLSPLDSYPKRSSQERQHNPRASNTLINIYPLSDSASHVELELWHYYVNRFARTYPTDRGLDNPFLSCLIPIAAQFRPVKCAMLAMAACQANTSNQPYLRKAIFSLRKEAISECLQVAQRAGGSLPLLNTSSSHQKLDFDLRFPGDMLILDSMDKTCLATTAILLVLLAKLSGESYSSLEKNLDFAEAYFSFEDNFGFESHGPPHVFLRSLLNYNQLLALIATTTPNSPMNQSRQNSPVLKLPYGTQQDYTILLRRISTAVEHVSLSDIHSWDGDLNFIPSLSTVVKVDASTGQLGLCSQCPRLLPCVCNPLMHIKQQLPMLQDLYRTVAQIYFFQQLRDRRNLSNTLTTCAFPPFVAQENIQKLVEIAVNLLRQFPEETCYNSTLLMPLGILASELKSASAQAVALTRLEILQNEFHFEHLGKIRQDFLQQWLSSKVAGHKVPHGVVHGEDVRLVG